jgi:hypothetical protein
MIKLSNVAVGTDTTLVNDVIMLGYRGLYSARRTSYISTVVSGIWLDVAFKLYFGQMSETRGQGRRATICSLAHAGRMGANPVVISDRDI